MPRLGEKVALISGAAQGIGEAVARLFVAEGARVVIGDIQAAKGERLADELGASAVFTTLDVTCESDWETAISMAKARFGRLDILVNNAGVGAPRGPDGRGLTVDALSVEAWEQVMSVNARGVFLGTKHAVRAMRPGGGSIVNISSITGLVGSRTTAYGASKGAVTILTKSTAISHAHEGIRCNSIHPGAVETPILDRMKQDRALHEANLARHPMGRFGTPEEIAYGALYLASDEAAFVTGAELVIDGGLTAQ